MNHFKTAYMVVFALLVLAVGTIVVAHSPHPFNTLAWALSALTGMAGMAYGAQGQIPSAQDAVGRNTNSIMQGFVDRGPWIYWDDLYFVNATQIPTTIDAFSIAIGQQNTLGATGVTAGVAKSKLQTNMVRGNQFAPPRCLLLLAIGFQFSSDFLKPDIDKILNSCYFEFRIDEKIFHEGWLVDGPAGAGLAGVSQNSGEAVYTNGLPSPYYQRRFGDWAKYIAPEQQFSMKLIFGGGGIVAPTIGSGSTAVNYPGNLRVTLDGLTDRSVQ